LREEIQETFYLTMTAAVDAAAEDAAMNTSDAAAASTSHDISTSDVANSDAATAEASALVDAAMDVDDSIDGVLGPAGELEADEQNAGDDEDEDEDEEHMIDFEHQRLVLAIVKVSALNETLLSKNQKRKMA
jgi:hypothetical protein